MNHRSALKLAFIASALCACGGDGSAVSADASQNQADADPTRPDAGPVSPGQLILPTGVVLDIPEAPDTGGTFDCGADDILCVPSEHPTIQLAADVVVPGDTVVVSAGSYAGFTLLTTGTEDAPIRFIGRPGAVIDDFSESEHGIVLLSDFDNDYYVDYAHIVGFTIDSPIRRCVYLSKALASRPSVGHLIAQNTCLNAGSEGFVLSQMSLSVIEDNIILNAGNGGPESERDHGIYLSNGGTGNSLLRRNIIMGSSTAGIHHNGDRFVDTGGTDGIISGLVVDGNIVVGNGQNAFNMDGVQDSTYINNLLYGNAKHGIRAYAIDGAEGPRNIVAINNTIIGGNSGVKVSESLGDHVVFNNLFAELNEEAIAIPDDELTEASNLITSDLQFVQLPANLEGDVAELASFDFRVTEASRAQLIDQGQPELGGKIAPTHDQNGSARQGSPDIGGVEY